MHNTLKLVEQIVYMLIVGGLQGSGVDFSEENQEFYWLYCRYTVSHPKHLWCKKGVAK